jgi:hypothetical protein
MLTILYFVIRTLILIACAAFLFLARNPDELSKTVAAWLLPLMIASLFESVRHSWGNIRLTVKVLRLGALGKPLRISFAALIRIKVGDDYLLLKSKTWNQYSPPGGVYRYFDPELKKRFELTDDEKKAKNVDELRLVFVGGSIWNVFSFIKWFETRKGRESDPHREFAEELIHNGILSSATFADVMFEYQRTIVPEIDYSVGMQKHQLFAWEIFSPVLSNAQLSEIKNLKQANDPRFCFLTEDVIRRDGLTDRGQVKIGSHSKHIL